MFTEEQIKRRLARKDLADPVLERFTRYVKIETTSDSTVSDKKPTTETQFDLANLLVGELKEIGCETTIDEHGFVIGKLAATKGFENADSVLFISHMDTSDACSGKNVNPIIHEDYDGGVINIGNGLVIDPNQTPNLKNCIHDTIITTDGTTLLGSDDKAGIANIMTAVDYVVKNKIDHGPINIMFNTDEETGGGMDHVPFEKVKSKIAITVDSTSAPLVEASCFNAFSVKVTFEGVSFHPGYARGKLVNAANMAAQFITMIPRSESPEATDNDFGYFYVSSLSGDCEKACVTVNVRDFDFEEGKKRCERLKTLCAAVEAIFPGGKVIYSASETYHNMEIGMRKDPKVINFLRQATLETIGEIKEEKIRGGTDGTFLTEQGMPTPNLFTGGDNIHSRTEYAALSQMVASTEIIINLIKLASKEK